MLPTFASHPRTRWSRPAIRCPMRASVWLKNLALRLTRVAEALCVDPEVPGRLCRLAAQFHVRSRQTRRPRTASRACRKADGADGEDCRNDRVRETRRSISWSATPRYDLPLCAPGMIRTGAYASVRMIPCTYFTDFMYRPRRPEELDTKVLCGVVFHSAAPQVDSSGFWRGRTQHRFVLTAIGIGARHRGAYNAAIKFGDVCFSSLNV